MNLCQVWCHQPWRNLSFLLLLLTLMFDLYFSLPRKNKNLKTNIQIDGNIFILNKRIHYFLSTEGGTRWAHSWGNHGIHWVFSNTVCVVWSSQERAHNFKLAEACQLLLIAAGRFWKRRWHGVVLAGLLVKGLCWK